MNPEVPERERSPVPKRRWKPLDESDERKMQEPTLGYVADVPGASFELQATWSGH